MSCVVWRLSVMWLAPAMKVRQKETSGFRLLLLVVTCCLAFSSGRVVRTKYGTLKGITLQGSLHRSGQYCSNCQQSFEKSSRILQDQTDSTLNGFLHFENPSKILKSPEIKWDIPQESFVFPSKIPKNP